MKEGVNASVETVRVSCGGLMPAYEPRTHISVALDVPKAGKLPKAIQLRIVGGLDAGIAEAPGMQLGVWFSLRLLRPCSGSGGPSLLSLQLL